MKIKVGSFDVIESGSVIVERGKSVEFLIEDEENLKVKFNIIVDPQNEKYTSQARLINESELEIDLINYVKLKGAGGGSTKPYMIGSLQNRALYVTYYVYSYGESTLPVFNYTFYLGEEVGNAQ